MNDEEVIMGELIGPERLAELRKAREEGIERAKERHPSAGNKIERLGRVTDTTKEGWDEGWE